MIVFCKTNRILNKSLRQDKITIKRTILIILYWPFVIISSSFRELPHLNFMVYNYLCPPCIQIKGNYRLSIGNSRRKSTASW